MQLFFAEPSVDKEPLKAPPAPTEAKSSPLKENEQLPKVTEPKEPPPTPMDESLPVSMPVPAAELNKSLVADKKQEVRSFVNTKQYKDCTWKKLTHTPVHQPTHVPEEMSPEKSPTKHVEVEKHFTAHVEDETPVTHHVKPLKIDEEKKKVQPIQEFDDADDEEMDNVEEVKEEVVKEKKTSPKKVRCFGFFSKTNLYVQKSPKKTRAPRTPKTPAETKSDAKTRRILCCL